MRFKILLKPKKSDSFLPIDYTYALSAAVYKIIGQADQEYATFLHNVGYKGGVSAATRFKHFVFSRLKLPRSTSFLRDRGVFHLKGGYVGFEIGFAIDTGAEHFIRGLFTDQMIYLGDKITGTQFEVAKIETVQPPVFNQLMEYRTLSPILVKAYKEGKKYPDYISPRDSRYVARIKENLANRMQSVLATVGGEGLELANDITIETTGPEKSRLNTIKAFSTSETKVKSFDYQFKLTADPIIQEWIWNNGLGEETSLGFGMVKEVKKEFP
jgi:CRISPR-associated endoribonuclease Cas6